MVVTVAMGIILMMVMLILDGVSYDADATTARMATSIMVIC